MFLAQSTTKDYFGAADREGKRSFIFMYNTVVEPQNPNPSFLDRDLCTSSLTDTCLPLLPHPLHSLLNKILGEAGAPCAFLFSIMYEMKLNSEINVSNTMGKSSF